MVPPATTTNTVSDSRWPFVVMALLALAGAVTGYLVGSPLWPAASLGWLLAAALGLGGWWSVRRALAADVQRLLRVVFGGMLVRLAVSGILLGLVLGLTTLAAEGFVGGLLGGFVLFMLIEIVAMERHTRRGRAAALTGASDNG